MLLPYLPVLNKKKVILGSQSKCRRELVEAQQLQFERISSNFAEDLDKNSFESASDYNLETCRGKVVDLLKTFSDTNKEWDLLICGDTIVVDGNKIIEKPIDEKDCIEMISSLSNKTHQTLTAHIIVFNTEPQIRYEWVTGADVTFGEIPLEVLEAYAKTPESYSHSGGYELTAVSGSFIKSINGSFTCVQGLDTHELGKKIIEGAKQAKWI